MGNDQYNNMEELLLRSSELLIKSEERIDRTNAMVDKTFSAFSAIAQTYENQINKLQECRDCIIKQNTELIKLIEKQHSEYRELNKRYDDLIDKLINQKTSPENNITIKQ